MFFKLLYFRDFWRRHRRKFFITTGVVGSGYLLYKLYNDQKRKRDELERELALQSADEEFIKAQLSAIFGLIFFCFIHQEKRMKKKGIREGRNGVFITDFP